MVKLKFEDKAPDFKLQDQTNQNIQLSDFAGHKTFLYFYPKANTAG